MAELVKFTEKTIDYAKNPRNQGDMENPTAIGEVSNPDCGDSTIIYLKVEDNIIKDVTFETFGCAAAVASSSMLTEMIKGKTKSGFEYEIPETVGDDYEVLEALARLQQKDGGVLQIVTLIDRVLGSEQRDAFKEHCRVDGRVSTEKIAEEFFDIFSNANLKK